MSASETTQNLISDIDSLFANQLEEIFKDIEDLKHDTNKDSVAYSLIEELEIPNRTHMDYLFGTSS